MRYDLQLIVFFETFTAQYETSLDLATYGTRLHMSYRDIITIEPDKRGGKPCIRRMRITVYDVLGWLAAGMSIAEIIDDFPELTEADIRACLEFAADREHRLVASVSAT